MVNQMANVTGLTLYKTTADGKKVRIDGAASESSPIAQGIRVTNSSKLSYPAGSKVTGIVEVEVTLDASGTITATKIISGDKTLQGLCEANARSSKFEIPKLALEVVKVTGVLTYNFAKDRTVIVANYLQNVQVETKPNKYHSLIRALTERVKNAKPPAAEESKFVRDGKADVIVRLNELKPEVLGALKQLGFEVLTEMSSANAVVGRISVEKLSALAELDAVTFISPQGR